MTFCARTFHSYLFFIYQPSIHPMASMAKKRSSSTGNECPPKRVKIDAENDSAIGNPYQTQTTATSKVDANGDRYWEISKMRRVTISSFRGKTMVNIREYYEKDGQELPGKKVKFSKYLYRYRQLTIIRLGYFYADESVCFSRHPTT